jgi:hypothetical protein
MNNKFIYPENFNEKLTTKQIKQWKEKGYLLLNNLLETNILNEVLNEMKNIFNIPNNNQEFDNFVSKSDFGSNGICEFPCKYKGLKKLLYLKIL